MTAKDLAPQGLAILLGAASGGCAYLIGLPLPWLLGAMIGTTAASVAGLGIRGPNRMRPFVVPVIGVMLGSAVTSDILSKLLSFWPALLLLPVFLILTASVSYVIYRRFGRFDRVTAYFASMPGGLNDMMLLAEASGGQARKVALAHATRILAVISFVVLFYGFVLHVGQTGGNGRPSVPMNALTVSDWFVLIGCAYLGARLGRLIRLPAPEIFGAMILSGAAHATGLVHTAPPTLLVISAQVVLGTIVGCRFLGVSAREIGRDIVLGVLSSIGMIGVALAMAIALTRLTGDPLSLSFLVLSPGGLTEMSLLALAMGQDVVYVTAIHILRITLVIGFSAPILRWIGRRTP